MQWYLTFKYVHLYKYIWIQEYLFVKDWGSETAGKSYRGMVKGQTFSVPKFVAANKMLSQL